jgi:hypothetical protein
MSTQIRKWDRRGWPKTADVTSALVWLTGALLFVLAFAYVPA